MASHFAKLAKHLEKPKRPKRQDSKGILEALASEHEEMSQHHAGQVEFHHAQVDGCMKGMGQRPGERAPTNSAAQWHQRRHARRRAVPRAGQQPVNKAPEKPKCQSNFRSCSAWKMNRSNTGKHKEDSI